MGRPPLRPHEQNRARRGTRRRLAVFALIVPAVIALSGCSDSIKTGFLPSTRDATNQTDKIISLWNGSWIAALAVGVVTWGLMLWCVVAYRRRREDTGLPAQVFYNMPLEIMYTVIPLMMIAVVFFYTAKAQAAISDVSAKPDVKINVVGKQWAWDFVYSDAKVYEVGLQAELNGKPGVEKDLPTLYLPVGKRVEFELTSRDVIHSFWVPYFLYKMDVIPGVDNKFQVVPNREGTFRGKCAELCGEYHSEMLFNVKVVSLDEYNKHLADLKAAGNVGDLSSNLGRSKTPPGGAVPGNPLLATQPTGSAS